MDNDSKTKITIAMILVLGIIITVILLVNTAHPSQGMLYPGR